MVTTATAQPRPPATKTQVKPPLPKQNPAEIISGLRAKREESPAGKKTSFLVYGPSGAGKTTLLATAVRPVFIDSFDPSGLDSIRQGIGEGWIIADHQWEQPPDNIANEWSKYERTLRERLRSGLFEEIGTYCLDGMPLLNTSLLAWGETVAPTSAERSAYLPAQVQLLSLLRRIVTLPCDVIVTTLPYERVDQDTGRTISITPAFVGKVQTPTALFSEIYYLEVAKCRAENPVKGLKVGDPIRSLVTNNELLIKAKSRLSNQGQIPLRAPCDIKAIKKMAGLPYEDKQ